MNPCAIVYLNSFDPAEAGTGVLPFRAVLRRLFVEWPVKLFNAWWTGYGIVLTIVFMVVGTLTVIAIVLDVVFGIRWGW